MYEIHCAVAMALCEEGLDAFSFPRTRGTKENIVIRVPEARYRRALVFTAFVDGDILAVGEPERQYLLKQFSLPDPDCFTKVKKWLCEATDEEQPYDFRDERLGLGDMLHNWIANTPRFHLVVDKGAIIAP